MMKIAYLLESTCLCGGVKVVLRQAKALEERGHEVTVLSPESYPSWFKGKVGFQQTRLTDKSEFSVYDHIIVTTPFLVNSLYSYTDLQSRLWHLCQGYEGDCREGQPHISLIKAAYRLHVPKLTVSQCLSDRLYALFGGTFISVGQGLEHEYFYPANTPTTGLPKYSSQRIILVGPLNISIKRIRFGLEVLNELRHQRSELQIVRVSVVDTRQEEEKICGHIDEYYCHLKPEEVGGVFRQGGVLFSPSSEGEGFGLPALEAMACGIPTVLSAIPSYLAFACPRDYAVFMPLHNKTGTVKALCQILEDAHEYVRLRQRGLEVAQQYSFERVAERIECTLAHGS